MDYLMAIAHPDLKTNTRCGAQGGRRLPPPRNGHLESLARPRQGSFRFVVIGSRARQTHQAVAPVAD